MGIPEPLASEPATHCRSGFQSGAFLEERPRGTNVPFHPAGGLKELDAGADR
jgi:hypothetical protein